MMKISFFIDVRYYLPNVTFSNVKAPVIGGHICGCKALAREVDIRKVDIDCTENVLHTLESDCTLRDLVQQREVVS